MWECVRVGGIERSLHNRHRAARGSKRVWGPDGEKDRENCPDLPTWSWKTQHLEDPGPGPGNAWSSLCSSTTEPSMAIPRMFNTEAPFVVVAGGSGLPSLTKEDVQDREEDKGSLAQAAGPHLSRVTELGTAKHMGAEGPDPCEENLYVSIIAQAEGEGSQEFSPTTTGRSFPRPQLLRRHSLRLRVNNAALGSDTEEDEDPEEATQLPLHRLLRRRQCKKPGRRERRWRRDGDVEEPPIIQGLWVQEIDWLRSTDQDQDPDQDVDLIPPPPQFEDYGDERSVPQPPEGGGPPSGDQNGDRTTGSSRVDRPSGGSDPVFPRGSELDSPTWDPMEVSGFDSSTLDLGSASSWRDGSDSSSSFTEGSDLDESRPLSDPSWSLGPENLPGPCDVPDSALEGLRGKVSQVPRNVVSPFFQKLLKQTVNVQSNEGILLHSRLHPSRSRYREGEEYHVLHHIQNGSYGDVFCIRDSTTGFECAAKRILLSHFSSEEVCTWSALDSPRVVELFGAVIEGPSITLFMDLKPGCLAQLLRQRGSLPQDLALHYLHQVLGALEHLHQRHVLHLDVKVDNVLLSADGRDAFLCDFGLSETSDLDGRSAGSFTGSGFPGTETHMAPEVARGERRCCKSDVWSSCCMLLHMLNGCQPWTRFYTHPLCLKIVSEPPPLWEVPSTCNHFTAEVFRAGLQKEPGRRASARELRRKTTKALRAVGGLSFTAPDRGRENRNRNRSGIRRGDPRSISSSSRSGTPSAPAGPGPAVPRPAMHWVSPWRTRAATEDSSDSEERISDLDSEEETGGGVDSQPKSLRDDWTAHTKDWESGSESEVDIYMGEGDEGSQAKGAPPKTEADYEGDWEEDREEDERESSSSADCFPFALWERFPLLRKGRPGSGRSWGSEPELVLLRGGVPTDTSALSLSPEPRDHPPSCFSGSDASLPEASDKDSDRWSDDVSSGVFSSYSSQTDGHLEWLVSANQQPASHCFQGVDIWIENCQGESLRIRERRRVQVGHVAVGVSEQIPLKAFSLETLDLQRVPAQQEVHESGLWLRCVPAPEHCQRWSWRVNQGQLEIRE